MTQSIYTPYERLFKDIMNEFNYYPTVISDSYHFSATKENYLIESPLIGITKEQLNIKVEDGFLIVEAKPTKVSKFVKNTEFKFTLAEDADEEKVSAKLENGLLTITIPRITASKKSLNVKVN